MSFFQKIKLRYFAKLSYLGTKYHGWQIQANAITVQDVIQQKLSILLRKDIEVTAAGRTDAGVHAFEMCIHFDTDLTLDSKIYCHKINILLPKDIVFHDIIPVHDEAHSRFDAIEREYRYHILMGRSPFSIDTKWQISKVLDINIMNESARFLLDFTNFKSFSKSKTDTKNYHCNIFQAEWTQKDNELIFTISANRFLRNMIRAIVGTLYDVGIKKIKPDEINMIIRSENRCKASFSAPAHGLFLTKILYHKTIVNG